MVGSDPLNLDSAEGRRPGKGDAVSTSGVDPVGSLLRDLLAKKDLRRVVVSGLGVVKKKAVLVSPEVAFLRLANSSLNSFRPWKRLLARPAVSGEELVVSGERLEFSGLGVEVLSERPEVSWERLEELWEGPEVSSEGAVEVGTASCGKGVVSAK